MLDPAHNTLGGSVAYHNPSFVSFIKRKLADLVHEEQAHIIEHITLSIIGVNNGVIGASLLGFTHKI